MNAVVGAEIYAEVETDRPALWARQARELLAWSKDFQELRNHVGREIGPIAKPKTVPVVPELPKTRSGKIMRRLLKDVAEGREAGDASIPSDNTAMAQIAASLAHRVSNP